ncbi:MAG: AraC family transcriptional regulator [Bacteroidota bacterium]
MILIPQKLFELSEVNTILRAGNVCILEKTLTKPVNKREGYVSNHVISIILAGEQRIVTYEDEEIVVSAGEVLLIPRGMYYTTDLLPVDGSPFRCLLFYFDDAAVRAFLATSKVVELPTHDLPDHLRLGLVPAMRTFTENLLQLYRGTDLGNENILRLKQQEMLHLLNEAVGAERLARFLFRLTLPRKRNLRSFMEANYTKPLTMEDYAYLTGRSVSSFRRDFKANFSTTPLQWLRGKRMDRALELFENPSASVGAVSREVGYQNTSYFIRGFRERMGLSPKQYLLKRHRS